MPDNCTFSFEILAAQTVEQVGLCALYESVGWSAYATDPEAHSGCGG